MVDPSSVTEGAAGELGKGPDAGSVARGSGAILGDGVCGGYASATGGKGRLAGGKLCDDEVAARGAEDSASVPAWAEEDIYST